MEAFTCNLLLACVGFSILTNFVSCGNVAFGKTVTMSTNYGPAAPGSHAVNGIKNGNWYDDSCASTLRQSNPWMLVDLEASYTVTGMQIVNRADCCPERLRNLRIDFGETEASLAEIDDYMGQVPAVVNITFNMAYTGRYLRIRMLETDYLTICEIEVYEIEAPVDGGWSNWTDWTECSATCGSGTKTRSRTCDNPAPLNGGADCPGDPMETMACNTNPCPVDGGWTDFSQWSQCSQPCGTGLRSRSRECTNPAPMFGGEDCVGNRIEIELCNTEPCPDSCEAALEREPANCNDIRLNDPGSPSGEYSITTATGAEITVYCEFFERTGYIFIAKESLSSLTSLDGLYSRTDHALLRIQYVNGEQHDIEIEQFAGFKNRYPLSFQLSSYEGYKRPVNFRMTPYIYVGFIPVDRASLRSDYKWIRAWQGYTAGGEAVRFRNCDKNPNSFIAFFANADGVAENPYYKKCCNKYAVRAWFWNAQPVPTSRKLPPNYFMFEEMHMGGCGGYFTSSHGAKYKIDGATVGLPFEYNLPCSTPET